MRAEFLSLREQDFVTAARALGVDRADHLSPHDSQCHCPRARFRDHRDRRGDSDGGGLSFLGLGVPPPHATWGNILSDGKNFIFDAPWLTFVPGIAILIVVLSFNLFGEGLRDVLNPKFRDDHDAFCPGFEGLFLQ